MSARDSLLQDGSLSYAERHKRGITALQDSLSGCPLSPERLEWAREVLESLTPDGFGIMLDDGGERR